MRCASVVVSYTFNDDIKTVKEFFVPCLSLLQHLHDKYKNVIQLRINAKIYVSGNVKDHQINRRSTGGKKGRVGLLDVFSDLSQLEAERKNGSYICAACWAVRLMHDTAIDGSNFILLYVNKILLYLCSYII